MPPDADEAIVGHLGRSGLASVENGWVRAVVEKPFGHDLESGRHLNHVLQAVFPEKQIYRIDHYLGKETVQNIFVLRFANGIFEPLWNHRYVDHVQISVAESVGVGHRAGFYESAGVLRDMFQNHLLQLLTLTAMEPPAAYEADAIRAEKVKVLESLRPFSEGDIDDWAVRGQYGPGVVDGKRVAGYREEPKVDPASNTPTYAAVKIAIDNWRWAGVPFYLRSGKRLGKRVTEVAIEFKGVPHRFFSKASGEMQPNVLRLHIQPDEGVSLKFGVKIPGLGAPDPAGLHGFPVCEARRADRRRLRAAAPRRHARRPDPLHPRRRGGARLGSADADPGRVGEKAGARVSELRRGDLRSRGRRPVPGEGRAEVEDAVGPAYASFTSALPARDCAMILSWSACGTSA